MGDTAAFLTHERDPILDTALQSLDRMHTRHYDAAGVDEVQQRLNGLFDQLIGGVQTRNLGAIVTYAEKVAQERFAAGYDLSEVQIAFNALEEATWSRVLTALDPSEVAHALAHQHRPWRWQRRSCPQVRLSLAANTHAPSLDLREMFRPAPRSEP